jgi:hypothetical protein
MNIPESRIPPAEMWQVIKRAGPPALGTTVKISRLLALMGRMESNE